MKTLEGMWKPHIPDFKAYVAGSIAQTVWDWDESKQTGQWNACSIRKLTCMCMFT